MVWVFTDKKKSLKIKCKLCTLELYKGNCVKTQISLVKLVASLISVICS